MTSDLSATETELREKSRAHKRLMNKAVHYLGQYQASRAKLRVILQRFAKRKIDSDDDQAIAKAIEEVISLMADYGYVDDEALAASKTRQGVLSGQSSRQLTAKLKQMGVNDDVTEQALKARQDDWHDPEWAAILIAARKKRLGPFGPEVDFEGQQKQMAKLARAGFSLDLIRKCLAIEDRESAEKELDEAQSLPRS